IHNSVVYPGTHDNDTAIGWWNKASDKEKQFVAKYLGDESAAKITEINWEFIQLALASVADLAILPLQDILGLDDRARMNDPSVNAGNWRWRYESSEMLTPQLRDRLLEMTQIYSR
ncbi:4-alpha-glucanotransferase, partial [Chroococcidiopsis cubana CCALA 043]